MRLDECCRLVAGGTPDTSTPSFWNGNVKWVTPKDMGKLESLTISQTERCISDEGVKNSSAEVFPANSVILSSRAPIGYVAVCNVPMATNQGCKTLIPDVKLVSPYYLAYWLQNKKEYLQSLGVGATFKEISKSALAAVQIPLPPLPEQQRIVALLDEADRQRALARQQLAEFDKLAEAVFVEMFGDPVRNEMGWEVKTIRDIVSDVKYGTSKPSQESGEYVYLRMNNITDQGEWDFSDLKQIDLMSDELDKYLIRHGDLAFNRTNSKEKVGKCAVYRGEKPMAIAGYLIRVRANEFANTDYISGYLNSQHGKATLRGMCKSIIGMANINAQELQDIKIPVPPIQLQNRYRSIVLTMANEKKSAQNALQMAETLFQSLMHQSFGVQ